VKEKLKLRFMDEHIFRKDRICLILFWLFFLFLTIVKVYIIN
jgi:hypothetical protein